MLDQITLKPEATRPPCALCGEEGVAEVWDVPMCLGHHAEIMSGDLLVSGAIDAAVTTKPWSKEELAKCTLVDPRKPGSGDATAWRDQEAARAKVLERYRMEFDGEARKRVAVWVAERRRVAA